MSTQKNLKKEIKRVNKSKEEIKSDLDRIEKINHIKDVVRKIYPSLEEVDSIYDAQTVVNAVSGFIMAYVEKKASDILLSELGIDLSKEEDTKIKIAMLKIMDICKNEKAKDLSSMLERMGKTMSDYGSHEFLKKEMKELPVDKILA